MKTKPVPAVACDDDWAEHHARSAEAVIPGREGLYRCLAGIEPELVADVSQRFVAALRPRSEREVSSLSTDAGLSDVPESFSSLLYSAWCVRLGQAERTS